MGRCSIRIKTETEFKNEFGDDWRRSVGTYSFIPEMDNILGETILVDEIDKINIVSSVLKAVDITMKIINLVKKKSTHTLFIYDDAYITVPMIKIVTAKPTYTRKKIILL